MDYDELIEMALYRLTEVRFGQVFVLKDLFEGYFWNQLSKGDRLGFGKYFKNKVALQQIPYVRHIGKAKNNSAQYIKEIEGKNETANL